MKKVIFTGLIVFLALFLAACGVFNEPEAGKPEIVGYTEDGRPIVNLSINTGGISRSLKDGLAKAGSNYVEVVFHDTSATPDKYYRTSGYLGLPLTLAVPVGAYSGEAIMLAGRNNDKTLLATGVITATAPGGGTAITASTTSVTFTLTSLTAALNADATPPSFVITDISDYSGSGWSLADTTKGKYESETPCFQLPVDDTNGVADIEATLTIAGFTATGSKILVKGSPTLEIKKMGPAGTPSLSGSITGLTSGTAIGTSGIINFTLGTGTSESTDVIFLTIPVVAMDTTIPGIIEWNIRGGLDSNKEDFDGENGGGIVVSALKVAAIPSVKVTIVND